MFLSVCLIISSLLLQMNPLRRVQADPGRAGPILSMILEDEDPYTSDHTQPDEEPEEEEEDIPVRPPLYHGRDLGAIALARRARAEADRKLEAEMVAALEEHPDFHGWDYEDYIMPTSSDSKFDLHSRNVGLTYSQVGTWTAQDILEGLEEKFPGESEDITVATEEHKDGGVHFHVFIRWHKKKRIRSSSAFDVGPLHPNIKKVADKAGMKRWLQYVTKEGNFITNKKLDMSSSHNYIKRKMDHIQWKQDGERKARPTEEWGSVLLFGQEFDISSKKRSIWICGASDAGKTTHVRQVTRNTTVFLRKEKPYFYEGYNGEKLIISDDQHTPDNKSNNNLTKAELCHMLNGTWNNQSTCVYGATRYCSYFLQNGVNIHYIVITNAAPEYLNEDWFKNRFHCIEIERPIWDEFSEMIVDWEYKILC